MRRASDTTAPARTSSVPAATSPPLRRFHRCSAPAWRSNAPMCCAIWAAGSILEIGAGSGRLAADVLSRLEALGRLPQRYLILDVSADLRERQRRMLLERVPHLFALAQWLTAAADRGLRRRHSGQRSAGRAAGVAPPLAYDALRGVGRRRNRRQVSSGRRARRARPPPPHAPRSQRRGAAGRTAT